MSKLEICKEMKELREYLDKEGIEWRDDSDDTGYFWMCRTKFEVNGDEFSVINGMGSYGGLMYPNSPNIGLLECWINRRGEPKGDLTAKEVIKKIEENREKK